MRSSRHDLHHPLLVPRARRPAVRHLHRHRRRRREARSLGHRQRSGAAQHSHVDHLGRRLPRGEDGAGQGAVPRRHAVDLRTPPAVHVGSGQPAGVAGCFLDARRRLLLGASSRAHVQRLVGVAPRAPLSGDDRHGHGRSGPVDGGDLQAVLQPLASPRRLEPAGRGRHGRVRRHAEPAAAHRAFPQRVDQPDREGLRHPVDPSGSSRLQRRVSRQELRCRAHHLGPHLRHLRARGCSGEVRGGRGRPGGHRRRRVEGRLPPPVRCRRRHDGHPQPLRGAVRPAGLVAEGARACSCLSRRGARGCGCG